MVIFETVNMDMHAHVGTYLQIRKYRNVPIKLAMNFTNKFKDFINCYYVELPAFYRYFYAIFCNDLLLFQFYGAIIKCD